MRLVSREYKVMLDQKPFADPVKALKALRKDLDKVATPVEGVVPVGDFDVERRRTIAFLDTEDHALRRNGFILRRRMSDEKAEYTLKCRSEDRYFAAGANMRTAEGFKPDKKFEEDIAPPFLCRFSRSNTVRPPKRTPLRLGEPPKTLDEAIAFFPGLRGLASEGQPVPGETPLAIVNGVIAFERVYTGTNLVFEGHGPNEARRQATVALILWSDSEDGKPLVAEFSFRLEDEKERYSRALAIAARSLYAGIQGLSRARPKGKTKTAFIYRDADTD